MEEQVNRDKNSQEDMLANEAAIVEAAKTDDSAFEVLYDFYFPKIYGYIFKRIGDFDIARDLVSATFLKAFARLDKYKSRGHAFGAWLYRIATNNLIDYYRKAGRRREISIDKLRSLEDHSNIPEENFRKNQEKEEVRRALAKLPGKHQEILCLKFFAEKENNEIADILKTNENNVRVMLCRALKKFKEEFKQKQYERGI